VTDRSHSSSNEGDTLTSNTELMAGALQRGGVLMIAPRDEPFILKSGRESWFFFNFGNLCDPEQLEIVAGCYVDKILELGPQNFDFIFGPAYKGIPLAAVISLLLYTEHGIKLPFSYNRKEEKTHGETGLIVGYQPKLGDRALIIDDVVTTGGAKSGAKEILEPFGVIFAVVLVGVDRSQPGALEELEALLGAKIVAITTHEALKEYVDYPDYVKDSPGF